MAKIYGYVTTPGVLRTGDQIVAALGTTAAVAEPVDYSYPIRVPGWDSVTNPTLIFVHNAPIVYMAHRGNNYIDDSYFHSRVVTVQQTTTIEDVDYGYLTWVFDRIEDVSDYTFLIREDTDENMTPPGSDKNYRISWFYVRDSDEFYPDYTEGANYYPNVLGSHQVTDVSQRRFAQSYEGREELREGVKFSFVGNQGFTVWWACSNPWSVLFIKATQYTGIGTLILRTHLVSDMRFTEHRVSR